MRLRDVLGRFFCLASSIGFLLLAVPNAEGDTLVFSFSEWGAGFICDATGSSPIIPLCSVDPTTHLASFARVPSGFVTDPTPGGGSTVLAYSLPFSVGTFDAPMIGGGESAPEDLVRSLGSLALFYSVQTQPAVGNCATFTPPISGCDGLADVPNAIPAVVFGLPNCVVPGPLPGGPCLEIGPEGDNHGILFIPDSKGDLIEFIPHSDQLTACPPQFLSPPLAFPLCGPMNIAPPVTDPFRFITGLGAPMGIVNIPTADPTDPIATLVPEPSTFLTLIFSFIWLICRSFRYLEKVPKGGCLR